MATHGKESVHQLRTTHPKIQALFEEVIRHYDHKVLEGHRGKEAQDKAFQTGHSKLPWPKGNHNTFPSRAVDAAPFPVQWGGPLLIAATAISPARINQENLNALIRFYHFAGFVQGVAAARGVKIRWLGDSDGDFDFAEEKFKDLVHFELAKEES